MDLRRVTGYVALALLAGYWVWVLSCTTPELRRGTRDRVLRGKVFLVKTAALVLTALVVGTIHFWATAVWHVLVTAPVALAAGFLLRRVYRRLVAVPRHRLPLAQRVRRAGHLHVISPPHGRHPAHRMVATSDLPTPRQPADTALGLDPSVAEPDAVTEPADVASSDAVTAPRPSPVTGSTSA